MKTNTLKSMICLATIILFASACGKDAEKKKKSAACDINSINYQSCVAGLQGTNPYSSFTGVITGTQAYGSLQQWAAATETLNFGLPAIQVTKSVSSFTSGCNEENLVLGFKLNICNFGSSGSGTNVTSIVTIPAAQVRSQYPAMAAILNPVAPLFLVSVSQSSYSTYDVLHADSATNKTIKYVIDTNLHAALQPRVKEDSINKKREILVYPN